MILLTSTSDLVQVVTSGTQNTQVHASYLDQSSGTFTPGRLNTIITTATTTNVVGSPLVGQRNLKYISIQNTDSTNANTVTVQHTDGTNVIQLFKVALIAGYTITYNDLDGWLMFDASGGRIETPLAGRLLKTTFVTTGTTFQVGQSTNTIKMCLLGGGGGGGGCSSVTSDASFAGGGGAGGYLEKTVAVTPGTTYTIAIGAAGSHASGAAGGNGGNTTFTVGATTYTANGGSGAALATAVATAGTCYAGGNGGAVSTNGDINGGGAPGDPGIMFATTPLGMSGSGGSTCWGGGGAGLAGVGAGNAATGFGAGGGGAGTGSATARAGGAPTAGAICVYEYS